LENLVKILKLCVILKIGYKLTKGFINNTERVEKEGGEGDLCLLVKTQVLPSYLCNLTTSTTTLFKDEDLRRQFSQSLSTVSALSQGCVTSQQLYAWLNNIDVPKIARRLF
jgi:hypothetical protein